ncbi:MAG: J domain-containing protein [Methylomonas lenta]|jgi:DnaJ-class molecular chaperone|nr:J domain-containing protein [Methylomonas lenta]
MLKAPTYYDTLKVTRDAPDLVIQNAYRALMKLNHPDNFTGREEEAVKIAQTFREARDVLLDPITRLQYDRWLDKQEENPIEQFHENRLTDCLKFCNFWNQKSHQANPKLEKVSMTIQLKNAALLH